MANAVRVRVELKYNPHASYDERAKDFQVMFGKWKKHASEIKRTYERKSRFESKPNKIKRKRRASEVQMLKDKLRENFGEFTSNKGMY